MFQDQELGSSDEREKGGEKRKGAEKAYGGIFRHGVLERRKERERRLDDVDQLLLPNRAASPDFILLGNQSQSKRQRVKL